MAIKRISANLLGGNAVTAAKIAGGAISAADIANNSITAAKLSTSTFAIDSLTVNTSDLVVDTANNRVGIGATSSGPKLFVSANSTSLAANFINSNASGFGANITGGSGTNYALKVEEYTGNELFRINGNGNVGIGTSSPASKLTLLNNTQDGTTNVRQYATFGPTASWLDSDVVAQHGAGIGEVQIHNGASNRPPVLSLGGSLDAGELLGAISFFRSSNTDGYRQRASIYSAVNTTGTANQHGGDLRFTTAADGDGSPSERMRIDSSGKVGIVIPGAGYNFSNNAAAQTLQIGAYNNSGTYEVPTLGLYYSTVPLLLSNGYDGTYGTGSIGLNKIRTDNASSSFSTAVNGAYHSVGIDFITGTGDSSIDFRTETGVIAYVNDDVQSLVVNTQATHSTANKFGLISRGGMQSTVAEGGSGGTSNSYGSGPNRHISFSYHTGNQSYAHSIASRHNSGNRGNNTIDFYIWEPSLAESAVASDRAISIHNGALELVPITTTQRDAFGTGNYAYNGMILYNETEGKFQGRANGQWINFKTEDDFPVTDSLYARYTADSFTYNGSSTPPTWNDVSGNSRNISTTSTSTGGGFWVRNSTTWPTKVTNSTNSNGASKSFDAVQFENTEGLALPDDSNISAFASSGFSFAYVARYLNSNGTNANRIMDGKGSNNLIGFWDNQRGVNFDGSWIVGSSTQHSSNLTEWCIIVFRSSQMTSKTKNNNSGNWVESGAITHNYTNANYSASGRRYGLNAGNYGVGDGEGEDSDFEIAEWCFWNKDLSDAEMDSVQSFLETKYGI